MPKDQKQAKDSFILAFSSAAHAEKSCIQLQAAGIIRRIITFAGQKTTSG